MRLLWNEDKNIKLKTERGICFDDVARAIDSGSKYIIEVHSDQQKYPNQYILIIQIKNYFCKVPFVVTEDGDFFFKTVYPSRKEQQRWTLE